MQFIAKNLGPVRDAQIDLSKSLIVLTGPNNSGKTYLAWSIYDVLAPNPRDHFKARREDRPLAYGLAKKWIDSADWTLDIADLTELATTVIGARAGRIAKNLSRFFATDAELFKHSEIQLTLNDGELTGVAEMSRARDHQSGFDVELAHGAFSMEGNASGLLRLTSLTQPAKQHGVASGLRPQDVATLDAERLAMLVDSVASVLMFLVMADPSESATLFPAERTAINMFARELALKRTELVDEVLDGDPGAEDPRLLISQRAGRYPIPTRTCIEVANDLAALRRNTAPPALNELASELEQLMGGEIAVSDTGELGFAPNANLRLPFHVASSLVKSLASLVFYFRHLARPGNWIVIDEPELNLHPKLQREVARFLAKAVSRGMRVLLTTHSDYIVREFSNLVVLGERGEAGKAQAKELRYDPECLLSAKDVGVYLVRNGTAESQEVSKDGFTVVSIDDVIEAQNQDTQAILFGSTE